MYIIIINFFFFFLKSDLPSMKLLQFLQNLVYNLDIAFFVCFNVYLYMRVNWLTCKARIYGMNNVLYKYDIIIIIIHIYCHHKVSLLKIFQTV